MRPSRRRRSSSRAARDKRLAPGAGGQARRPGGDDGPAAPRTLPSRRLGDEPLPGLESVCAREGGGGGGCARTAVSLPHRLDLPRNQTPS